MQASLRLYFQSLSSACKFSLSHPSSALPHSHPLFSLTNHDPTVWQVRLALLISSRAGGQPYSVFGVLDAIQSIKPDVQTLGLGACYSYASLILVSVCVQVCVTASECVCARAWVHTLIHRHSELTTCVHSVSVTEYAIYTVHRL